MPVPAWLPVLQPEPSERHSSNQARSIGAALAGLVHRTVKPSTLCQPSPPTTDGLTGSVGAWLSTKIVRTRMPTFVSVASRAPPAPSCEPSAMRDVSNSYRPPLTLEHGTANV